MTLKQEKTCFNRAWISPGRQGRRVNYSRVSLEELLSLFVNWALSDDMRVSLFLSPPEFFAHVVRVSVLVACRSVCARYQRSARPRPSSGHLKPNRTRQTQSCTVVFILSVSILHQPHQPNCCRAAPPPRSMYRMQSGG